MPRALDKARGSDPWHSATPVLRHRAPWKACGVRTLRCLKGEGVSELRGTLAPAVPCGQPPQSPIAQKASVTAQPALQKAWSNEPQCALARGRSQIVPTTSSKSSALRPEAVSYTPVAHTALEKRTVITATLSFDCGASFTESDYTAPSSPCSSAAASDWSDATEKFVQLFPDNAFPLLDAELQRLTPATPPVNPPAAAPATPVVQQQRQRQQQQQQQQRRRRGGYNRSVGSALWQHIAKAERLLDEPPASLKAKGVENGHEQKRLSSSSWFFRRNGLYIDGRDNSVSTAAPAPCPQPTVAMPLSPHPAVESSKGKQADSVAHAELAVGMLVKRVSEPSQVGKVLKVEGSSSGSSSRRRRQQRVCVDFSLSNGRARTWLNADELEEAPRKPAQKCPHPPQSLKAKLWYKKQMRVHSGKKQQ